MFVGLTGKGNSMSRRQCALESAARKRFGCYAQVDKSGKVFIQGDCGDPDYIGSVQLGRGGVSVEDALGEVTHIRARDNTVVGTAFTSPGGKFSRSAQEWNATVSVPPRERTYDQPTYSQPQFDAGARPRKPIVIIAFFAIILAITLYFLTQGILLL